MRVLVVSHPCVTPKNQNLFALAAQRGGWDLTIAVPDRWSNDYGDRRAEPSPGLVGQLVKFPVLLRGNIPLHVYLGRLRRFVRDVSPDVAYIHHEPYAAATLQWALALRDIPFAFYSAQNVEKHHAAPIRWAERYVYGGAGLALPVTRSVEAVLRRKGYRGPLEVLPLPVEVQIADAPPRRDTTSFRVGYIGRLTPEKGVDALLRALARTSGIGCRIAGDGPDAPRLRQLVATLGLEDRVDWLGYVDHDATADFYRSVHVVVVPSRTTPGWTEQFGRVVLEALAAGVPVIASDSGELPTLVGELGGGWIVPEDDVEALAATIARASREPRDREQRARVGRHRVEAGYGLSSIADRLVELLDSLRGHAQPAR